MGPRAFSCQPGTALCTSCLGHHHLSSPGTPLHPRVLLHLGRRVLAAPAGSAKEPESLWGQRPPEAPRGIAAARPGAARAPRCGEVPVICLPKAGTGQGLLSPQLVCCNTQALCSAPCIPGQHDPGGIHPLLARAGCSRHHGGARAPKSGPMSLRKPSCSCGPARLVA